LKHQIKKLELPYYAIFLLIAAFLASHNAAKEDKRLFMKYHGKQRKRLQNANAKNKVSKTEKILKKKIASTKLFFFRCQKKWLRKSVQIRLQLIGC
jgi:hypothetical protein